MNGFKSRCGYTYVDHITGIVQSCTGMASQMYDKLKNTVYL